MIKLILMIIFFVSTSAIAESIKLDSKMADGSAIKFLPHEGAGKWDNYLVMNLPFRPAAEVFKKLEETKKIKLKNRGEAHITVITPIEYWQVLRGKDVTMSEINRIAKDLKIQQSKVEVVCIGRGQATLNSKDESTYFVVVNSQDLIGIRRAVQKLFITKGGKAADFDPNIFYPHITLGFTKRDLHESDGIIKNSKRCSLK
jgi:hypothetical protein